MPGIGPTCIYSQWQQRVRVERITTFTALAETEQSHTPRLLNETTCGLIGRHNARSSVLQNTNNWSNAHVARDGIGAATWKIGV